MKHPGIQFIALWTPTAVAWALFGWKGLLWGSISVVCSEVLKRG